MGKKSLERQLEPVEAKAVINRIRISPQKLNLVAQIIRGMNVADALTQLTFSSKRIANDVKKGLQSAIANAENNHNLNVDSLFVKEAYVGKNIVMKRMHTRGRGKSARVFKPFSNLTLIVREQADEPVKKAKKPAAKKETKAAPKAKPAAKAKKVGA
ncbi:MAG: 50S ribosomal protein L22 [Alphaproteobacteria bacterium]|nr:50S ribosomal protein L22 [Alphaproteobacteria bacterium]